jgi:RNA polymerase sigma-70 factor (ECF subfamily)
MLSAATGRVRAFEQFYEQAHAPAFSLALRMCRSRTLAEDVVQQAFLEAWRGADRYDQRRGTQLSWVLGIVRHRSLDALRRRTVHEHRWVYDEHLDEHLVAPQSTVDQAIVADRGRTIRGLLAALPPPLELAYFSGLSHSEIATRLAIPIGTVKGRIRLALHKLRADSTSVIGRDAHPIDSSPKSLAGSSGDGEPADPTRPSKPCIAYSAEWAARDRRPTARASVRPGRAPGGRGTARALITKGARPTRPPWLVNLPISTRRPRTPLTYRAWPMTVAGPVVVVTGEGHRDGQDHRAARPSPDGRPPRVGDTLPVREFYPDVMSDGVGTRAAWTVDPSLSFFRARPSPWRGARKRLRPMASTQADDPTTASSTGAAISNAVVRLMSEYTGRGPTKARTHINNNLVTVVLEDVMTKGERSLVHDGNSDLVLTTRFAYQQTMRRDLIGAVQDITGREVAAFMSANHIDPDMAVETFVLVPEGPEKANQSHQ